LVVANPPPAQPARDDQEESSDSDSDASSCDEIEEREEAAKDKARGKHRHQQQQQVEVADNPFDRRLQEQHVRAQQLQPKRRKRRSRTHKEHCFLHNYDSVVVSTDAQGVALRNHLQQLRDIYRTVFVRSNGDSGVTARQMHCYFKAYVWDEGRNGFEIWRTYQIKDCIDRDLGPTKFILKEIRTFTHQLDEMDRQGYEKGVYTKEGERVGTEDDVKKRDMRVKYSNHVLSLYSKQPQRMLLYDEQSALDLKPSNTFVNPAKFMSIIKRQ
jgi:hypothetical protein